MRIRNCGSNVSLIVGSIVALVMTTAAHAACPTFHTLSNGASADASQVMDNFNHILGCAQFTGNIGINTGMYSWGGPFDTAVDIGSVGAIETSLSSVVVDVVNNMFYNGSNWVVKTTGYANLFRTGGSDFEWWQAPSTVSGNIGTQVNVMLLDYYGNLTIKGCLHYNSSTLGTCLSDRRVKENVKSYNDVGLAEISALRPVTFSYNGLAGTPNDLANRTKREGLVAQEVQKVAPDLVSTVHRKLTPSDPAASALLEVNYGALTFGLINAVKELKAINENQAEKINRLEAQLRSLKQRADEIQTLRKRISTLERMTSFRTAENGAATN